MVLDPLPAQVGHPGHVDEEVVGSKPERTAVAAMALGERVQGGPNAERREEMRPLRESGLTPLPGEWRAPFAAPCYSAANWCVKEAF